MGGWRGRGRAGGRAVGRAGGASGTGVRRAAACGGVRTTYSVKGTNRVYRVVIKGLFLDSWI